MSDVRAPEIRCRYAVYYDIDGKLTVTPYVDAVKQQIEDASRLGMFYGGFHRNEDAFKDFCLVKCAKSRDLTDAEVRELI